MPKTKSERETELLTELQDIFGYRLLEVPERDRWQQMINFASGKMHEVRVFRLTVPANSALGRAARRKDKPAKPHKKTKAHQ